MSKRFIIFLLTGFMSGLTATADLVVDAFTIDQVMNGSNPQETVFDFTGTILGRERDAADESEFAQAAVMGGELVITGSPFSAVFLVMQWDGFDGDNSLLNPFPGIGNVDFTQGGENNLLEFGFEHLTLGNEPLRIEVVAFSGLGNFSVAELLIETDITNPTSLVLPFSEFFSIGGSGADFTGITAVEILIETPQEFEEGPQARGPFDNLDLALNFIQATVGADADLTATMVDEVINESIVDGIANPGETIRYTITVTNAGPDGVEASTLANLLPPGLTLVPGSIKTSPIARDDLFATPPATSVTIAGPGVLRNDNDPDGDPLVIDSFDPVTAFGDPITLAADGSFTYTPTMTSGTDTFHYAISDGVFTNDAQVSIAIDAVAELAVSMTDDVDPAAPGQTVIYTTVVTNSGPSDALNVEITHTFPPGMDFLMAAPGPGITCNNPSPGVVVCDIPFLAVGATGVVSLSTQAVGSGFNTSVVEVTTSTFENDPSDNVDQEVTFINSPPVALDTVQVPAFGNTLRSVAAPGVLNGAFDPEGQPISVVTTTTNSLHGGTVTIQPDGSYEYLPAAGFRGPSDTFNFVISDGLSTDTGSVGLSISNMIWYVDNSQATNGDGTSQNPFNTIVDLSPSGTTVLSGPDAAGDTIFLHEGSGPYTGGLLLADQQQLIGHGVGLTIGGSNLVSAAGRPVFADEIVLAADQFLSGFDLGSTGSTAYGLTGGLNTLVINNMNANGDGGINLGTGAGINLDVTLDNLVSTEGQLAITTASGHFTVTGETRIADATGAGIRVVDSSSTNIFGTTLVTASLAGPADGVTLQNNTGTSTFASLNITTANGAGLTAIDGGTVDILTQPATIDASGGAALVIDATRGLSNGLPGWTFDTLMSTSGSHGLSLTALSDPFTVSGESIVSTPALDGVLIAQSPGITFDFGGITITEGAARGLVVQTSAAANLDLGKLAALDMANSAVDIDGVNNLNIQNPDFFNFISTLDGPVVNLTNITNAEINFGDVMGNNTAGAGVIMNTVAGNTTFGFLEAFATDGDGMILQNAGNVFISDAFSLISATRGTAINFDTVNVTMDLGTVIGDSGQHGISLVNVSGAINIFDDTMIFGTTQAGIDIRNSAGGTFTFGNMDIDTSTNNSIGLLADSGGSIGNNLTGASRIDAGTASTVNILNTELNLVFGSLHSTGGASPGIDLQQTTGSFTVDGDGVNTTRGGNGSGGAFNNKIVDAVVLDQVENVTLRRMDIDQAGFTSLLLSGATNTVLEYCSLDNGDTHGITGTGNDTLSVHGCTFNGTGDAAGENAIHLVATAAQAALTGTLSVTDTDISDYSESGIRLQNFSGTLNATVDNCDINDNNDTFGADALAFISSGTARINLDLLNSRFDDSEGAITRFEADGTSGNDLNIRGNTSTGGGGPTAPFLGGGIHLVLSNDGALTFDIQENTLTQLPVDGVRIEGEGDAEGRIGGLNIADQNTIHVRNDAAVSAAGSIILNKGGSAASPATGGSAWTILIQNNDLGSAPGLPAPGANAHGVQLEHREDNGQINLSIQDNHFQHVGGNAVDVRSDHLSAASPASNVRVVNNIFENLASDAVRVDTGDAAIVCIHAQGNEDGSSASPGVIDLNQSATSVLQVSQEDLDSVADANTMATVTTSGTITFSGTCSTPTLPSNP